MPLKDRKSSSRIVETAKATESAVSIEFEDQSRKEHFSRKIKVNGFLAQSKIFQSHPKISALNIRKVLNSDSNAGKTAAHSTALVLQGAVASHPRQKREW